MLDQLDMLNQLSALKRQSIGYFWLINTIVLAGVSSLIQVSHAEAPKDVMWGGVWLRGSHADRDDFYPVGSQFALQGLDEENSLMAKVYSRKLFKSLEVTATPSGGRILDRVQNIGLAKASSGKALVMACAVNYEFYETTKEAGENIVYAEVGFELLVCDFSTRSVVFALPGRMQYKDIWQGKKHIKSEIKKIYEDRLPNSFLELAKKKWDGETSFQTLGFGKVDVWEDAKAPMPPAFEKRPEFLLSTLLASTFSKAIDIPVMPYSKGKEAIYTGLVMSRLEDKDSVTNKESSGPDKDAFFVLEKPSYTLNLVIPAYRDVRGEGDGVVDTSLHYAFAKVALTGGAGDIVFDKKYEAGVRRAIGKGERVQSLWLASWDATSKLYKAVAKDIKGSKDDEVSSLVSGCRLR